MTDSRTDVIAKMAAASAAVKPHQWVNRFSRLVIDPERFPDEREEMLAVGMGAVYTHCHDGTRLRSGDAEDYCDLRDQYYEPYGAGLQDFVDDLLDRHDRVTIIDVHSYPQVALPYELHQGRPRPQISWGTDEFHTPSALLAAARTVFADYEQDVNGAFSGTYVPLKHYRRDPRVSSIMLEIRRDQYESETTPASGVRRLAAGLAELIDSLASG